MVGVQRECADASKFDCRRYPFRVHGHDARRTMLARARRGVLAPVVHLSFARFTHHFATLTGARVAPCGYRGIHMDRFIKVGATVLAFLLMLAVVAGMWATLAWVVKTVWQA